jgi:putative membrane protein
MKVILAAATAITVLSTPVLAQSLGEKTGINSVLGIAPKTADFVSQVAISDMFEIESSKLAQTKGNAETKKFAEQMVTDHTKTSTELKSAVSGNTALPIPTALDSAHQTKLDRLKGLSGAEFDREYRSQQVNAHEDAVSLFKRYSSGGDDAKLKEWATQTLPALQHHLEMAQALDNAGRGDAGSRALTPGQQPGTATPSAPSVQQPSTTTPRQ